jgi:hypothetical protein
VLPEVGRRRRRRRTLGEGLPCLGGALDFFANLGLRRIGEA